MKRKQTFASTHFTWQNRTKLSCAGLLYEHVRNCQNWQKNTMFERSEFNRTAWHSAAWPGLGQHRGAEKVPNQSGTITQIRDAFHEERLSQQKGTKERPSTSARWTQEHAGRQARWSTDWLNARLQQSHVQKNQTDYLFLFPPLIFTPFALNVIRSVCIEWMLHPGQVVSLRKRAETDPVLGLQSAETWSSLFFLNVYLHVHLCWLGFILYKKWSPLRMRFLFFICGFQPRTTEGQGSWSHRP